MPPKRRRPKASARKAKKEKSIPNPFDQPPPAGQLSLMSFAPVSGEPLLSQPGEADASAARALNVAGPKPRRGRTPMKRPSSHNAEDVAPTSKARPRKRPAAAASAEDTKASQAASASNKSSSNSSSSDSVSTDSTSKTDAAYVARPAFSPRKLRLESATEHDGDAFAAPSTIPATVMTDCKDLAGLFGFARRNVNRITEDFDSNALHNLARNLDGCKLLSLYSGLGGAELSLLNCWSAVCEAMTSHGKPPEALPSKPVFAAACDIDPSCQSVLTQHSDPPEVVVPDLCAFVRPEVLTELQGLVDKAKAERKAAAKDKTEVSKKNNKKSQDPANDGGEDLLAAMMMILRPSAFRRRVMCVGKKVLDVQGLFNCKKLILVAGSVCKDWSSMNQGREQLMGNYILPFGIMLGLARRLSPMLFLHECTKLFQPRVLANFLSDHCLHHTLLDPTDFGFPVKRGRSYSALVHNGYTLTRELSTISKLFVPCQRGCDVFLTAPVEEAVRGCLFSVFPNS